MARAHLDTGPKAAPTVFYALLPFARPRTPDERRWVGLFRCTGRRPAAGTLLADGTLVNMGEEKVRYLRGREAYRILAVLDEAHNVTNDLYNLFKQGMWFNPLGLDALVQEIADGVRRDMEQRRTPRMRSAKAPKRAA